MWFPSHISPFGKDIRDMGMCEPQGFWCLKTTNDSYFCIFAVVKEAELRVPLDTYLEKTRWTFSAQ